MCVAMVIIHTKTLEKKAVDDVTPGGPQPHEPPAMSQALFSCGVMESGRRPVGSSLESLWDSVRDLSLSEAPSGGPPNKRQCRSLSCSDSLSSPSSPSSLSSLSSLSSWRPQGSRVWMAVEKRRCHSGGSVHRSTVAPPGSPAMQRSSSFSFAPQSLRLSPDRIGPTEPELERRLSRSRSQPCVHNGKKSGVKRRRPAHSHKQRPSLDLLKMTQLQDFHSPGFTGDGQTSSMLDRPKEDIHQSEGSWPGAKDIHQSEGSWPGAKDIHQSEGSWLGAKSIHQSEGSWPGAKDIHQSEGCWPGAKDIHQSEGSWPGAKERESLWAGLCSRRGRDLCQLGGELDIEQIERN
ncbi:protein FAM53B isoform X2 [Pseudorasbora parva]|uniref:protein FAM53B isoform X2 n=1 Tax=Pseudorasbora parva TaxID=51549 RepID=UPI00351E75ED